MDDGLIFPYPRAAAGAEGGDAEPVPGAVLRGGAGGGRTDLPVGKP
jgi:hypothetical protein